MELYDYLLSDGRKLTKDELRGAFTVFRKGVIAEALFNAYEITIEKAMDLADVVINTLNDYDFFDGSSPEERAMEQVSEDYNLKEREGN